jgi:hypothetical protein
MPSRESMMAEAVEACRQQDHLRGAARSVADKASQSPGFWAIRLFRLSKLGQVAQELKA